METVHAIVDGNTIQFLEPVPVKGKYDVTVIFNHPVDENIEDKIKRMESCFGIFDDEDVKLMEEIVEERLDFSKSMKGNITYSSIQNEDERQKLMMSIVGSFDDEIAKHFYDALEECRSNTT